VQNGQALVITRVIIYDKRTIEECFGDGRMRSRDKYKYG